MHSAAHELVEARRHWAFTLIELLVITGVIAILPAPLLPALSSVNSRAQGIKCLSNIKQRQLAWQTYADDKHGRIVPANQWCIAPFVPPGTPITNLAHLRNGKLGQYTGSTSIYKCPGDRSGNVRSYSMSTHMNGISWDSPPGRVFRGETKLTRPSDFLVFTDEDMRSINDAWFRVDMASAINDRPAAYHNQRGYLSYADGHAASQRWSNPNFAKGPRVAARAHDRTSLGECLENAFRVQPPGCHGLKHAQAWTPNGPQDLAKRILNMLKNI